MPVNFFKSNLINTFKRSLKISKKFNENSKINDYKNWDSLGNFNILLEIEKTFEIKFTSKEFTTLNSFKDIYNNVKGVMISGEYYD